MNSQQNNQPQKYNPALNIQPKGGQPNPQINKQQNNPQINNQNLPSQQFPPQVGIPQVHQYPQQGLQRPQPQTIQQQQTLIPSGPIKPIIPGGPPQNYNPIGQQPQPITPVGQPKPIIPGGQHPQPIIPGGQQPQNFIPGGLHQQPIIPGGQPKPITPVGQPKPIIPGGLHQQPIIPGGQPKPITPVCQPKPIIPGGQHPQPIIPGGPHPQDDLYGMNRLSYYNSNYQQIPKLDDGKKSNNQEQLYEFPQIPTIDDKKKLVAEFSRLISEGQAKNAFPLLKLIIENDIRVKAIS